MKLKNSRIKIPLTVLLMLMAISSCGVYTMSGINLPPSVKTISIASFYNNANLGPPNLSQTFTNNIRDYYQSNTNLVLTNLNGDLQIDGGIQSYRLTPIAPTASGTDEKADAAARTRITITVEVNYYNTADDTYNFENKTFSFFEEFDNDQNLTAVEDQLIETIFDQIILDIFNETVANW